MRKKSRKNDDVVHVKSRTYGDHPRARRGTYKEAKLNKAFKLENKNLVRANLPAKLLKDAIDPYRTNLPGGLLWQRLGSLFRLQWKERGQYDFRNMERFEFHADYPIDRFVNAQPEVKPALKNSVLLVEFKNTHAPNYSKTSYIDGYRFTVIGVFPDLVKKKAVTVSAESRVYGIREVAAPLLLELKIPRAAKNYVVCLKIEGFEKGQVNNLPSTTGLCVVGGGTLH
ncbi:MAG: hypothetical protein QM762_07685 [Chryseolinea sp.]